MNIITISREFGSGGRELGKRLADLLGYDYYDKEIIAAVTEQKNNDNYVTNLLKNHGWLNFSVTFSRSFAPGVSVFQSELFTEQKEVIEQIAALGKNFVIVGRSADVLLKDYNPFKIFVCADMKSKIKRCTERAGNDEKITPKELSHKIKSIDKSRANIREIIDGETWGNSKNYNLTVNTSDWSIKDLSLAVKDYYTAFLDK